MSLCSKKAFAPAFLLVAILVVGCSPSPKDDAGANTENPSPDQQTQTTDNTPSNTPSNTPKAGTNAGMAKMNFPASKDMKFIDEISSNRVAPKNISELKFISKDGSTIKLGDYMGKQNVVLVFTEGFNGMLCPFCKTQTSRLIANYQEFQRRDCEIIVVYPGPKDHIDEFIEAALETEKEQVDRVPFPIVLDEEFAATDFFDIHSMHAHPSTYLIDKQGGVQLAYVGENMTADRPSVKAILKKLDELESQ